jgi:3-methyl-2-oxobutanoate hydroxymethyltransferase
MSHLGLTPQTKAKLGGYRVQGKTAKDYEIIRDQALRLQDAGCSFLLLEAMPRVPAKLIAEQLKIPVYGIGAGNDVDGQLVILHDLIGLFFEFKSKFVKRYCDAGLIIQDALHSYASDVREGNFPTPENFYEIKEEELEKMLEDVRWKYEKIDISSRQHISAIDI